MLFKKLVCFVLAGFVWFNPLLVSAQEAVHSEADLSSTQRNLTAGNHENFQPVIINVGGNSVHINDLSMLTAAEHVAVQQVLQTGQQSLQLGAAGNAIGGNFITSQLHSPALSNLVIPNAVSAVHDFGSGTLNLGGNLTNSGNLYAVSTSAQVTSANIFAANIFNQQGALISSLSPSSLPIQSVVSNLNLNLVVANGDCLYFS